MSSISIYYALESNIRVKSYDNLNFSRASFIQFRASQLFIGQTQTSESKVMAVWIFLALWCLISSILINYAPCRNLPFCGRARWGSRVRLPKEENARSRHQCLFVENVGKTEGNRSWRTFQILELYLRLRKVLVPLTLSQRTTTLILELCEIVYLNFLFLFFIFEVDKSRALAPTYLLSKRKSDLRSSF